MRFPRQLVPLSIVATQLVAFAVMLGIVLVLCLVYVPDARGTAWLAVPAAAVFVLFVGGLALAVTAANAVFRDVQHVVAALLLPWFFLTPILYRLEDVPGADAHPWLVDLIHWGNPLSPAVETIRTPLFYGEAPPARRTRSTWPWPPSARSRWARSSSRASTTGSRSKSDHDPSRRRAPNVPA